MEINYITDDTGQKLSVILPMKRYLKLLEYAEMSEDIRLFDEGIADNSIAEDAEAVFARIEANRR